MIRLARSSVVTVDTVTTRTRVEFPIVHRALAYLTWLALAQRDAQRSGMHVWTISDTGARMGL
jgi:hypothetical protein